MDKFNEELRRAQKSIREINGIIKKFQLSLALDVEPFHDSPETLTSDAKELGGLTNSTVCGV